MTDVDLTEFFKYSRPRGSPCKVNYVLGILKPKDRKSVEAALEIDKSIITGQAISLWLKKREHTVTPVAIANHRRGACSCAKEK